MRFFHVVLLMAIVAGVFVNCQPDEFVISKDPAARLRFSQDTVLFDTVFTGSETITRRFQVFNDLDDALLISSVVMGGGSQSPYSATINGMDATALDDIRLLGKDSLLVLVSALINPVNQDLPFIVTDSLIFETNGNLQQVQLAAWGQDANYLSDSILSCNTIWSGAKPYVIYNSVLVDSLCLLQIQPGTRIFSHKGSSIFVKGTIQADGTADNRITFLNDRLDEAFQNAPGQWGGIYFLEGSKNNRILFSDIRNSEFGIWLGTPDNDTIPDLVLDGVRIENMSRSGVVAFTSDMKMVNTLVNNCLEFAVGGLAGGNYYFENCTLANYSFQFFRQSPTFAVSDNLVLEDGSLLTAPLRVVLVNSIIWGDQGDEIIISNEGGEEFNTWINYNILKTTLSGLDSGYNQVNADPLFISPESYDFHLDSLSGALDAGLPRGLLIDLDGTPRDSLPDLGSYERTDGNL